MEGEVVAATHGTVSDTNCWANAIDVTAANVAFAMKKYYLKSKKNSLYVFTFRIKFSILHTVKSLKKR